MQPVNSEQFWIIACLLFLSAALDALVIAASITIMVLLTNIYSYLCDCNHINLTLPLQF